MSIIPIVLHYPLTYSLLWLDQKRRLIKGLYISSVHDLSYTVCPGSSDPPENICNIFASENKV